MAVMVFCLRQKKALLSLPVFIFGTACVLSAVILLAERSEQQAQAKAKALCASAKTGENPAQVVGRTAQDQANKKHGRWVQVDDHTKNGEGDVTVIYRGVNLLRMYTCDIKVASGKIIAAHYTMNEPSPP
ncbi:MAG: hypothetical protein ACTS8S_09870 [Giesbergeria sp.]